MTDHNSDGGSLLEHKPSECLGLRYEEEKKISQLVPLRRNSFSYSTLSRRGLNPMKPVYDPNRPDGRLNLTASAFNQLGQ